MKRLLYKKLIVIIFSSLITGCLLTVTTKGQEGSDSLYRFLFYNTENLFDTSDDPVTDDDEFIPGGTRRWTQTRFNNKINSIYKVIVASGTWQPPVIIGLMEIENRYVLERLISDTYLTKYNYGIIHYESADLRGIDVGLIYMKDIVKPLRKAYLIPSGYSANEFKTRGVLYTKFLIAGDTIHLFLNHWPSRRGGVLAGENERQEIAGMVREKADSISRSVSIGAKIIIAGDFNCSPDDQEMKVLEGTDTGDGAMKLKNISSECARKGLGTYKYRGAWEMLDQVIISEQLLTAGGLRAGTESFRIFDDDFLLTRDDAYTGLRPHSTYSGYTYKGGFSDHLPVILDLISASRFR